MFRKLSYSFILALLVTSLAFGGELRKLWVGDLDLQQTDGGAAETATSPGGATGTRIHGGALPWDNAYSRTIRPGDLITRGPWVDVRAGYGTSTKAVCDGVTDDGAALNSIIDNVPNGYKIILPGVCKTTVEIDFAGKDGLVVEGKGWPTNGSPVTSSGIYYAGNAGRSAVSLAGATNITFRDFEISSSATTPPKALLLLGRTSGGSFGTHNIDHVKIKGYATQALVYSIASEGNVWDGGTYLNLDGGGAKYLYYTSFQDNLALGGLTSSTNTTTFMAHMIMGLSDPIANSANIYIQTTDANATDFKIRDSLIGNGGTGGAGSSYVEINMAGTGGPFGRILIDGLHAEGGAPTYGLKITTDGGTIRALNSLTLVNSTMSSPATNFIYGADNTTINLSKIEYNYNSPASSVYNMSFTKLQYDKTNFTVRNQAFQNDIVFNDDSDSPILDLGTNNKNRVFYQKSGVEISGGQGGFYVNGGAAAGAVATDIVGGSVVKYTLTDNITMSAPTNMKTGQDLTFLLLQDGTGGFPVTWDAVFKVSWSDTGNTANKRSNIRFVWDGTNWIQVGAQVAWY
mgnify:CR=1 FL=1